MSLDQSRARRSARTAPGARLGEYLLERALGSGAMGSVYVGRHLATGARHALKVLHLGASPERRERFAREARALGKVDRHPGVIRIHRYDVEPDGLAYCALDLVEGSDLEALLEAHPAGLPLPRALTIAEGLARALAHVHAAGVIHRDLKPANVLLPAGADAPVLTDFGVARDEGEERLTLTQQLVGTPQYMAPEQVLGEQSRVGPPTDVFALGVVLQQLLTGTLPFEGSTFVELTGRICEDEPPPPRALRPELPRDLDRVVAVMLDKEPARRPTAAQVAEWLAAVGRGDALALTGSSTLHTAVRRLRRRRGLLLALGVALLTTALALALALGREDPARAEARATALALAHGELARHDAATLERLVTRTPPDVAPIASARERLLAFEGDRDRAVHEALGALEGARRRAQVELALLRGDDAAAREALAHAGGEADALLALRVAARAGAPGPGAASPLRPDVVAALLADAALERGDLEGAGRHLEQVREPALAPLRRVLEARLDLVRADHAAGRLDGGAAVSALKAAAARDPEGARRAVARVVARAAASGAPRDAARFVRTLHAAFADVALPGAAAPFHALALEAAAARRGEQVVALVDEGWRLDPTSAVPEGLVAVLATEGSTLADGGKKLEGYAVLLHAVRAGRADPTPMRRLKQLLADGVLDAWVEQHPDDWAGRLLRADTLADGLEARAGSDREATAARVLDDLERVLGAPALPPASRDLARVLRVSGLSHRPGHLERVEALLREGTEHDWRVCQRAAAHCQRVGDVEAEIEWSRRAVAAIHARIDLLVQGAVRSGTHNYFDGAHQLHGSYERLLHAVLRADRREEAAALARELRASTVLSRASREELSALIYRGLGRWREALEAARRCLELDTDNSRMLELVAEAEALLHERE